MNLHERAAKQLSRMTLCGLAMLFASAHPLGAQGVAAPGSVAANAAVVSGLHSTLELDGPWRFQVGDDPRWADPKFDDSSWQKVTVSQSISEQGFDPYSGYGWYRLRLQPQQLPQFNSGPGNSSLDLMVSTSSVGQLAV